MSPCTCEAYWFPSLSLLLTPSSFFSSEASYYLYCASFNFIPRTCPRATVYLERVMSSYLAPSTTCLSFSWSSLDHSTFFLPLVLAYDQPKMYSFHFFLPLSPLWLLLQIPRPRTMLHAPSRGNTERQAGAGSPALD